MELEEVGVVYVKRRGLTLKRFTDDIQRALVSLALEGKTVVSVTPNIDLFEVSGVWITWRRVHDAAVDDQPDEE